MHPIEPKPPEEQVNHDDPFFLLPMKTVSEANGRRSRLLSRPASAITEVLCHCLMVRMGQLLDRYWSFCMVTSGIQFRSVSLLVVALTYPLWTDMVY